MNRDKINAAVRAVAIAMLYFSLAMPVAASPAALHAMQSDSAKSHRRSIREGLKLGEVVVEGQHSDFGLRSSQMSALSITPAQITRLPTLLGEVDVLKGLQRLPGVQSGGDGASTIYVRGGDYDQNLILLDGVPLFSAEHLGGYTSAINSDLVDWVDFYRGAFPARYGGRLSSVINVGLRPGDFNHFHGVVNVGVLSSRFQCEGPIWPGHTSINLGARVSYFNLLTEPVLNKVYDKPASLRPYSKLNYLDLTARVTHNLSDHSQLTAMVYWGRDRKSAAPDSSSSGEYTMENKSTMSLKSDSKDRNNWGNLLLGINWDLKLNDYITFHTGAHYSAYRYEMSSTTTDYMHNYNKLRDLALTEEKSSSTQHSDIDEWQAKFEVVTDVLKGHSVRAGVAAGRQSYNPTVEMHKHGTYSFYTLDPNTPVRKDDDKLYNNTRVDIDTLIGGRRYNFTEAALWLEDEMQPWQWLRFNVGVRMALFCTSGKTWVSPEPRLSSRFLLSSHHAIKASYSHMAQGIHRLTTSTLVSPTDVWVPVTDVIPPVKSDLTALGYSFETNPGISIGIEGYYKWQNNLLEYREGASYFSNSDWRNLVVLGKGRTYGVELFAQKLKGAFTGSVSYTWSKSLRTFDRPGQEVNDGQEYYANNDRRHNLQVTLNQHFKLRGKNSIDLGAAFTWQSGRRGTLTTYNVHGLRPYSNDPYEIVVDNKNEHYSTDGLEFRTRDGYYSHLWEYFLDFATYRHPNGYVMPSVHHLDLSATLNLYKRWGSIQLGLSVYNVYNHRNVSNVFLGYKSGHRVLKGVCPFPIMPSINFGVKF